MEIINDKYINSNNGFVPIVHYLGDQFKSSQWYEVSAPWDTMGVKISSTRWGGRAPAKGQKRSSAAWLILQSVSLKSLMIVLSIVLGIEWFQVDKPLWAHKEHTVPLFLWAHLCPGKGCGYNDGSTTHLKTINKHN